MLLTTQPAALHSSTHFAQQRLPVSSVPWSLVRRAASRSPFAAQRPLACRVLALPKQAVQSRPEYLDAAEASAARTESVPPEQLPVVHPDEIISPVDSNADSQPRWWQFGRQIAKAAVVMAMAVVLVSDPFDAPVTLLASI